MWHFLGCIEQTVCLPVIVDHTYKTYLSTYQTYLKIPSEIIGKSYESPSATVSPRIANIFVQKIHRTIRNRAI